MLSHSVSPKNPGNGAIPHIVTMLADTLGRKLGRPSYVRQVKNRNEWFVTDPMFSFVQHGLHKGATGYRVGFFYFAEEDGIAFYLVHSPIMAQLFKKNLRLPSLIHVASETASLRQKSFLQWSSRSARRQGKKWTLIEETFVEDFVAVLHDVDSAHGFVSDLFPPIENQKTGNGSAKWAGNDFFLLLAEGVSALSNDRLASVVELSWPLFVCLYPVFAIEQRVASLARNLAAANLPKRCEYCCIADRPSESGVSALCRGEIEGAHIKPHSLGGTDRMENGLWLCQYHHRETEGRLVGSRKGGTFNVRFIDAP